MSTTAEKTGQPAPQQREYVDIIKADSTVSREFVDGTGVPAKIVYYCRNCEKIIPPKRIGNKLAFSCSECKGSNVAFGREESILNYYHIKKGVKPEV